MNEENHTKHPTTLIARLERLERRIKELDEARAAQTPVLAHDRALVVGTQYAEHNFEAALIALARVRRKGIQDAIERVRLLSVSGLSIRVPAKHAPALRAAGFEVREAG